MISSMDGGGLISPTSVQLEFSRVTAFNIKLLQSPSMHSYPLLTSSQALNVIGLAGRLAPYRLTVAP